LKEVCVTSNTVVKGGGGQLTVKYSQRLPVVHDVFSILSSSFYFYLIILITGCSVSPKEKFLEPELFAKIYVEVILQSENPADSDSLNLLQVVLDKYDVSKEEFEASIDYFESKPELWEDVFSKVVEELENAKKMQEEETESENTIIPKD
jgi:uncharacterized membrane protein YvbJ